MSGGYITPSPRRSGSTGSGGAPALTHGVAVRIALIGAAAIGLMGILVVRLWFLQVIGGQDFAAAAQQNSLREVVVQAPRGKITDRNGKVLVDNRPGQDVVAIPQELGQLSDERRVQVLKKLAPIVGKSFASILAKVDAGAKNAPFEPVVLADDVGPAVQQNIAERRQQFRGIQLGTSYVRTYPLGTTAAHILGYTGRIFKENFAAYRNRGYVGNERVGISALELQYEEYLKGTKGYNKYEVDALGEPTGRGLYESVPPRRGNDLRLSIDAATQRTLDDEVKARVAISPTSNAAAGIAMNPQTGEILGLSSYPTFSPSAFETGNAKLIARYNDLKESNHQPTFNRAIAGRYPAASTFKGVTATAALQEKILRPDEYINSPSERIIYKTRFRNFGDLSQGEIQLPLALELSSDTFFYEVGKRFYDDTTNERLPTWARRFGFGAPTGIDLPGEDPGLVPDKAYKRKAYAGPRFASYQRSWQPGDDVNLSIGQGFLQVTPLQLATAYSAIANGGTIVTPTLGKDVIAPDGTVRRRLAAARPTRRLPASTANLAFVREGLFRAANGGQGTAYDVFHNVPEGAKVAGKTGTAEAGKDRAGNQREDHSWFVGYAPFDNPTVLVAIVVENGGTGAGGAAPAVCRTMATYLKFDQSLCGVSLKKN